MTDITLPTFTLPRRALWKVAAIAALLACALVAGSIKVDDCWIIPGAFSKGFSAGFDVSRKVCGRATLGEVLARKIV